MTNRLQEEYAKRDLSSGSLTANLLKLTIPLAAQQVLYILYNLVNAIWLGRLSREALGAPGVAQPIQWIVVSLAFGFGSAGTALVAQYVGAKRNREADRVAGQTILFMVGIALVLTVPAVLFARGILSAYQTPKEMLDQATTYLAIVMLGVPAIAFTAAYGSILRALGDTMTVVVIQAIANVINIVLDPLLIFGVPETLGGFHMPAHWPGMGVAGAAVGTVVGQCFAAYACYRLLRRHKAGLNVTRADLKPDWPMMRKLAGIGLPAAVGNASGSVGFSVFQGLVNSLGTVVVDAYSVGFRIINVIQILPQCLAMAAAPIVGQALGAGNPKRARRTIRVCTNMVFWFTLPAVGLLMWQGHNIGHIFTKDADVVAETGLFFLIVPASSFFFGLVMVLSAAFNGSGHTRPVMLVTIMRLWLLRLPVGWLLIDAWHWGSYGIYWGMVAGNAISALVLYQLFRMGKWQKPVIQPAKPGEVDSPPDEITEFMPGE
jgi:putative MATE family efflux protein